MSAADQSANSKLIKIERCVYCKGFIENENVLKCQECKGNVHIKCLPNSSTPGDLIGDVFFDLTCIECVRREKIGEGAARASTSHAGAAIKEILVRKKLPWLIVLVLAFYNLGIKSKGLSHHGFFHWQNHIANFVEKNWKYLFTTQPRRRKRWIGTVAGVLSQNSPDFFLSGAETFNHSGWWKLTHANRTPKYIYMLYEQQCQKRQQHRQEKRNPPEEMKDLVEPKKLRHSADSEEDSVLMGSCSRALPYMGRKPKIIKQLNKTEEDNRTAVQSNLMDFLAETFSNDDLTMFNSLPSEALGGSVGLRNELIPFMEVHHEDNAFFDLPDFKVDKHDITNFCGTTESVNSTEPEGVDKTNDHTFMFKQKRMVGNSLENFASDNDEGGDGDNEDDEDEEEEYKPRIVQVTNFQHSSQALSTDYAGSSRSRDFAQKNVKSEKLSDAECNENLSVNNAESYIESLTDIKAVKSEVCDETTAQLPPCKPNLFTKQTRRLWPWLLPNIETPSNENEEAPNKENEAIQAQNSGLTIMSAYEEAEILGKLRKIFSLETKCQLDIPAHIRRFYRKLCVREWKRMHCKPLFDLDNYDANTLKNHNQDESTILDRYQLISLSTSSTKKSFHARIAGSPQYEFFQSPYTKRVLHPFIYRNKTCFPPWLKLLCEIQYTTTDIMPLRAPIDYCYVRPNHIAAVNALLHDMFWPGIDMSECLSYPDYSIIALYKQLVIGCGFLVPDVGYNEAYISFMAVRPGWQRSGIASFMLYHLTQTCMTKDITLHVSATNPAVMLYQKFGFKVEEIILNFYDKYLPFDSKQSRHALFLRLSK